MVGMVLIPNVSRSLLPFLVHHHVGEPGAESAGQTPERRHAPVPFTSSRIFASHSCIDLLVTVHHPISPNKK